MHVGILIENFELFATSQLGTKRSEMALKVIMERYPILYGVVDGLIPIVKSSLYLTEKTS